MKKRSSAPIIILVSLLVIVGLAAIPLLLIPKLDKFTAAPTPVAAITLPAPSYAAAAPEATNMAQSTPPPPILLSGTEGELQSIINSESDLDSEKRKKLFELLPEIDWAKYAKYDTPEQVFLFISELNITDAAEMEALFLCSEKIMAAYPDEYSAVAAGILSENPEEATKAVAKLDEEMQNTVISAMANGCVPLANEGKTVIDNVHWLIADNDDQYHVMLRLVESYQEIIWGQQGLSRHSVPGGLNVMLYIRDDYSGIASVYLALSDDERSRLEALFGDTPQTKSIELSKGALALGAMLYMDYEDDDRADNIHWLYDNGAVFCSGEYKRGPDGLMQYVAELVEKRTGTDILAFTLKDFADIKSAHISQPVLVWEGNGPATVSHYMEQTVTDTDALKTLSTLLLGSQNMIGGAGCPFDITLTLTLADGRTTEMLLASDSCPSIFTQGGVFLDYGSSAARKKMESIFTEIYWDEQPQIVYN